VRMRNDDGAWCSLGAAATARPARTEAAVVETRKSRRVIGVKRRG
jgi:hypothetical protein